MGDSNPIPSSSTTRAVVPIPQDDEPFFFERGPSAFEYFEFDEKDTEDDDKTLCVRKVANLKGNPFGDEIDIMEYLNPQLGAEMESTDAVWDDIETLLDSQKLSHDAIEKLGLWV